MAEKPKYKMTVEERAKQFMPFSPLSGLGRALIKKEKEKEKDRKKILADDKENELNINTALLSQMHSAEITYYKDGKYHKFSGTVEKVLNNEKIIVTKDGKINFSDVADIVVKIK